MGSGKILQHAIKKHGVENFTKEVLFVFDNEQEMNAKEAELVTEAFIKQEDNYNMCPGGQGGWGYINNNKIIVKKRNKKVANNRDNSIQTKNFTNKTKEQHREISRLGGLLSNGFKNKKHSEETKRKIGEANSKHQQGVGNSQYGSMWITNGVDSTKIKKSDIIPEGWYKGRK
jgi:hypothetical protein